MARTGVDHGVLLTPALKLGAANLAFPSWLTTTATAAGSADHLRDELLHGVGDGLTLVARQLSADHRGGVPLRVGEVDADEKASCALRGVVVSIEA
jgi:hypothetical protein